MSVIYEFLSKEKKDLRKESVRFSQFRCYEQESFTDRITFLEERKLMKYLTYLLKNSEGSRITFTENCSTKNRDYSIRPMVTHEFLFISS